MNTSQFEDLLDAQSRPLPPAGSGGAWQERFPEAILTLTPLLEVARDVAALLVPIRPRASFRAELQRSLIATARQQQAQQTLLLINESPGVSAFTPDRLSWVYERAGQSLGELSINERRWVFGAAVVGSALSLAGLGLITYVRRQRGHPAASA